MRPLLVCIATICFDEQPFCFWSSHSFEKPKGACSAHMIGHRRFPVQPGVAPMSKPQYRFFIIHQFMIIIHDACKSVWTHLHFARCLSKNSIIWGIPIQVLGVSLCICIDKKKNEIWSDHWGLMMTKWRLNLEFSKALSQCDWLNWTKARWIDFCIVAHCQLWTRKLEKCCQPEVRCHKDIVFT